MRRSRRRKCSECEEVKPDTYGYSPQWVAGGRNCFHLEWSKQTTPIYLCERCVDDGEWRVCDGCGALVEADYLGAGYLPDDFDGDPLCPECAAKAGHEAVVAIHAD
jgi:hypothetical protein